MKAEMERAAEMTYNCNFRCRNKDINGTFKNFRTPISDSVCPYCRLPKGRDDNQCDFEIELF